MAPCSESWLSTISRGQLIGEKPGRALYSVFYVLLSKKLLPLNKKQDFVQTKYKDLLKSAKTEILCFQQNENHTVALNISEYLYEKVF